MPPLHVRQQMLCRIRPATKHQISGRIRNGCRPCKTAVGARRAPESGSALHSASRSVRSASGPRSVPSPAAEDRRLPSNECSSSRNSVTPGTEVYPLIILSLSLILPTIKGPEKEDPGFQLHSKYQGLACQRHTVCVALAGHRALFARRLGVVGPGRSRASAREGPTEPHCAYH